MCLILVEIEEVFACVSISEEQQGHSAAAAATAQEKELRALESYNHCDSKQVQNVGLGSQE